MYFSIFIIILIVCFAILGLALLVFVGNYRKDTKTSVIRKNVGELADTTAAVISSERYSKDTGSALDMLCNNLRIVSGAVDADFFIVGTDGRVKICQDSAYTDFRRGSGSIGGDTSCPIHSGFTFPQELLINIQSGGFLEIGNLDGVLNGRHIIAAEPVNVGGKTVAYCFCIQPVSLGVQSFVLDILKLFLFSCAVAFLLCFVAVYIMTYNMIKPLRQMSYAAKRYSVGDFSPRIDVNGRDELASLCSEFNSMATALAQLESTRRSFVANVSHELKTPMTTIGGYIDAILDGTIPKDEQDHYLQIVSDEVKRLSRLVVAMLNMSKIEAGEIKLHPSRFDITDLIFNTMLSFEQLIDNKGIEVTGLDLLEPTTVNADRDMINQVIYNLIDNAVKFTPQGGEISVRLSTEGKNVSVSIRNTGAGISSEELSKVFERFYKVDKSRSFDIKGAGLGLYIVKTIVDMHSGTIRADSREGQFTEFTFTIPMGGF
jgi:signal transduction histidine kinase